MKKIAFTIADNNNMEIANQMINSLRKFHSEEELPVHIVTSEELQQYLIEDPMFFYRATPVIGKRFLKQGYDWVLKLDADQIIMGDLSHLWEDVDYDVGTVLNYNRTDPKTYGNVTTYVIDPKQYYNAGLVAMNNLEFVDHWFTLCYSPYFDRVQYREQDLLNIMCHFGKWKVKCFDLHDPIQNISAWHGLLNKGEGVNMKLVDGEVILPANEDGYPSIDVKVKVYHYAGGGHEPKNFRIQFNEELIKHIEWLISDDKEE